LTALNHVQARDKGIQICPPHYLLLGVNA